MHAQRRKPPRVDVEFCDFPLPCTFFRCFSARPVPAHTEGQLRAERGAQPAGTKEQRLAGKADGFSPGVCSNFRTRNMRKPSGHCVPGY